MATAPSAGGAFPGLALAPAPYARLDLSGPSVRGERALYLGREENLFFVHFMSADLGTRLGLAAVDAVGGARRDHDLVALPPYRGDA